jgi:orotidine-5'-phosphate decarboxylase
MHPCELLKNWKNLWLKKEDSVNEHLIVSLDLNDFNAIKAIIEQLKGLVNFYKIGTYPFSHFGIEIVDYLKNNGYKIMLDLKYHDIPNTVAGATEGAVEMGADFLTLHTSGGFLMLEAAVKAAILASDNKKREKTKLLGITVLTSLDEAYFKDLYGESKRTLQEQVIFLAQLARSAGLDGVVASPKEIRAIRQTCGKDFVIVTPGIRPAPKEQATAPDDQVRTMTPKQAIEAGANYLVVGRPIVKALNPQDAAKRIIKEMEDGYGKVT